jgi:hypothetical protein
MGELISSAHTARIATLCGSADRIFFDARRGSGQGDPPAAARSRAQAADGRPDRARSPWASSEDEVRSLCARVARSAAASQRVSGAEASDSRCRRWVPLTPESLRFSGREFRQKGVEACIV